MGGEGRRQGRPDVEYYTSNRGSAPLAAQIVQFNLKQIGLNVNTHLFARAVQIDKEGTRGEPFDITSEGWIADYADPYDFINVLLVGRQPARRRTTTTSRTSTTRSTTR